MTPFFHPPGLLGYRAGSTYMHDDSTLYLLQGCGGEAEPLCVTRSLVFAQGLVRADGVSCARVSGVFEIGLEISMDMVG